MTHPWVRVKMRLSCICAIVFLWKHRFFLCLMRFPSRLSTTNMTHI